MEYFMGKKTDDTRDADDPFHSFIQSVTKKEKEDGEKCEGGKSRLFIVISPTMKPSI